MENYEELVAAQKAEKERVRKQKEQIANRPENKVAKTSKVSNGVCPKCHTYCYGDCEAN